MLPLKKIISSNLHHRFQEHILKCWSENPEDRLDFSGIVHEITCFTESRAGCLTFSSINDIEKLDTDAEDITVEDTTVEDSTTEDATAEDTNAEDTIAEDTTAENSITEGSTAEDASAIIAEIFTAEDATAEDSTAADTITDAAEVTTATNRNVTAACTISTTATNFKVASAVDVAELDATTLNAETKF